MYIMCTVDLAINYYDVLCRCVFQFSHGSIQVNLLIVATSVGMLVCSTDNYLLRCVVRLVFFFGGGGGGESVDVLPGACTNWPVAMPTTLPLSQFNINFTMM